MSPVEDSRALIGARVTGWLILAFTALALVVELGEARTRMGDPAIDWDRWGTLLDILYPTGEMLWALVLLAWIVGMAIIARARGPARVAAIATASAAALAFAATVRVMSLGPGPELIERVETWMPVAIGLRLVARLGAIVALVMLARARVARAWLIALALASVLGPLVLTLLNAGVEVVAPLFRGPIRWGVLLVLASDAAIAIGFLGASVDLDDRSLDRASARSLELARALLWTRVVLLIASASSTVAALLAMRADHGASAFGDSAKPGAELLALLARCLGNLEATVGVALALALALIGLRQRVFERLLGSLGGLILFGAAVVGAGLTRSRRRFLDGEPSYSFAFDEHLRLIEAVDPYLRGASLIGLILFVIASTLVADPRGTHGEPRTRAIRVITIAAISAALWLFGREGVARLGAAVWLVALAALAAGIVALIDLAKLMRSAAEALERPEEATERGDGLAQRRDRVC